MINIWSVLNQTLSISLIAALILLIKIGLKDKLSPRWQYGIWSVLAIRMLFPVSTGKYLILPIPYWIETIKSVFEKLLDSNYTEIYQVAEVRHVFPVITDMPKSITDWLFVVYFAGVLVVSGWYLLVYFRLRHFLKAGIRPSEDIKAQVNRVCTAYGLNACKIVLVPNLPSAFVCGGVTPILALPEGKNVDDKVILHELLHLKYHDEIQNGIWCIFRSLHWCNPWMQYIFNCIENDMESLCDQRVLERLDGEERREYGMILLDMTNERYARVPGTSSISNGGENIKQRIEAIVRFKKYPKGMELVSACMGIFMLVSVFGGTSYAYSFANLRPRTQDELTASMAMARVNRCTTVAGALAAYAQGLIDRNGIYIACATSIQEHEELENMMSDGSPESGYYGITMDDGFEDIQLQNNYIIYNLIEKEEEVYEAYLAIGISMETSGEGKLIVPVRITKEDAWVVEEIGERMTTSNGADFWYQDFAMELAQGYMTTGETVMESTQEYMAIGETGIMTVKVYTQHTIKQEQNVTDLMVVNAEFDKVKMNQIVTYEYRFDEKTREEVSKAGFHCVMLNSLDAKPKFTKDALQGYSGDFSREIMAHESVNGKKKISQFSMGYEFEAKEFPSGIPEAYAAKIYWNMDVVEELKLLPVETHGASIYLMIGNKHAVSMNAYAKQKFVTEKDKSYHSAPDKSNDEIYETLKEIRYCTNEEKYVDALQSYEIFEYDTHNSSIPSIQKHDVEISRPRIFYDAQDENWIVLCHGIDKNLQNGRTCKLVLYDGDGEKIEEEPIDLISDNDGRSWVGIWTFEKAFAKIEGSAVVFYE